MYGYRTLRPEANYTTIELGYVGQTRQRLRSRDIQHREVQPFADIIVGEPYVIAQGMWTDAELDAAEQAAILRLRPRYNIDHNWGNPNRIQPWVAKQQRQGRDQAAGRVVWHPPQPATAAGRGWVVRTAKWVTAPVVRWWDRQWPWIAAWVVVFFAVALGLRAVAPEVEPEGAAVLGFVAASGVLWRTRSRRKPRRRSRRGRRS